MATALPFVGRKNFWLDESYSFVAAHRPLGDLWHLVTRDETNMSPYYLALHFWLGVGRSEGVIRLPSVVFFIATVPVVFALAQRLLGRPVAVLAGFLFALNLMAVQYAQEARAYSLVLLCVSLSALLFVEAVTVPRRRVLTAWMVLNAFACYAHYFAGFGVLAQLLSLALLPDGRRQVRRFSLPAAGTALLVAPIAVFIAHRGTSPLAASAGVASILDPASLFYRFAGAFPLVAFMLVTLGAALAVTVRGVRRADSDLRRWRLGFLWLWLLLPQCIVLLVSLVQPLWVDRYFIICLPPFIMLVAFGLMSISGRIVRNVMGIALICLMVVVLAVYHASPVKRDADWRAASAYVQQRIAGGDGVWFVPSVGHVPFAYYSWKRSLPEVRDVSMAPDGLRGRVHPRQLPPHVVVRQIREHDRLWVVTSAAALNARHERRVQETLGGHFRLNSTHRFGRYLMVRCYVSNQNLDVS